MYLARAKQRKALSSETVNMKDESIKTYQTQIRELTADLEESQQRLRTIFSSLPVGLLLVDNNGRIEAANARIEQMFDYAPTELVDQSTSMLLPELQNSQSSSSQPIETIAVTKQRRQFFAEVVYSQLNAVTSNRFLVFIQDVTQRHELERLKQEFLSMVSHDLRTPLTSIQFSLDMLSKGVFGEVPERVSSEVLKSTRVLGRLQSMINTLLDFEKLQPGRFDLNWNWTAVSQVLTKAIEGVEHFAEQHSIRIEVADREDLKIFVDEERLVQVLVNLISNAIKFSPQGAVVTIEATPNDSYVEFSVIDRGRGIPASSLSTIFERFKQVEPSDSGGKRGYGLGLPICKTIIEEHKGEIGVDSQNGVGSRFWFKLPRTQPDST